MPRPDRSERDKIAAKARRMARDPAVAAEWRAAWARVVDVLHPLITAQTVHARNWTKCPRCDGGALFTERDRKQGAICTYCDGNGEVPRFVTCKPSGSSSFYERQAGA